MPKYLGNSARSPESLLNAIFSVSKRINRKAEDTADDLWNASEVPSMMAPLQKVAAVGAKAVPWLNPLPEDAFGVAAEMIPFGAIAAPVIKPLTSKVQKVVRGLRAQEAPVPLQKIINLLRKEGLSKTELEDAGVPALEGLTRKGNIKPSEISAKIDEVAPSVSVKSSTDPDWDPNVTDWSSYTIENEKRIRPVDYQHSQYYNETSPPVKAPIITSYKKGHLNFHDSEAQSNYPFAHSRASVMKNAKGEKVRILQESQSDMHQAASKLGYASDKAKTLTPEQQEVAKALAYLEQDPKYDFGWQDLEYNQPNALLPKDLDLNNPLHAAIIAKKEVLPAITSALSRIPDHETVRFINTVVNSPTGKAVFPKGLDKKTQEALNIFAMDTSGVDPWTAHSLTGKLRDPNAPPDSYLDDFFAELVDSVKLTPEQQKARQRAIKFTDRLKRRQAEFEKHTDVYAPESLISKELEKLDPSLEKLNTELANTRENPIAERLRRLQNESNNAVHTILGNTPRGAFFQADSPTGTGKISKSLANTRARRSKANLMLDDIEDAQRAASQDRHAKIGALRANALNLAAGEQPALVDKIPDIPFKKTWARQTLKNEIKNAVEGGSSKFAIANPDDLHSAVQPKAFFKDIRYDPQTQRFTATAEDSGHFIDKKLSPDELEAYVGPDAMKELIMTGTTQGDNLIKPGFRNFYTNELPAEVDDIFRRHGIEPKRETEILGESPAFLEPFRALTRPTPTWDLTDPKIKEMVEQGFPLGALLAGVLGYGAYQNQNQPAINQSVLGM